MVDAGYLTQAEADAAFAQELTLRKSVAERFDILTAPHFALYVLDQVKTRVQHADDPYYHLEKRADHLYHAGRGLAAIRRAGGA